MHLAVVSNSRAAQSSSETAVVSRISRRTLVEFTSAMAALLDAGLPITTALTTAGQSAGVSSQMLARLSSQIARGDSVAQTLAAHGSTFAPSYVGAIRAGERSGDLVSAFRRLATLLERNERARETALSAAMYPAILALAGVLSIAILVIFVLPRFGEMLASVGAELPMSTRALLALSSAIQAHGLAISLGVVLVTVGAIAFLRGDAGRRVGASITLQLPVVGTLVRQSLTARTARMLATLLEGGSSIVSALDDTAASIANPLGADELERIKARVRAGASLAHTLDESTLYSAPLAQLVRVGESAGQVPAFLMKAAELIEERADRTRQRLIALLEPVMIVVFGGVIGFVALSLLQAIYGLNAAAIS